MPLPHVVQSSVRARMMRVRRHGTGPELELRAHLREWGLRYLVCPSDLPGTPDIANKTSRWAIFVHGCFWHAHPRCRLATIPRSNADFWRLKFQANRRRDKRKQFALERLGFLVLVVWQCELDDATVLRDVKRRLLRRMR